MIFNHKILCVCCGAIAVVLWCDYARAISLVERAVGNVIPSSKDEDVKNKLRKTRDSTSTSGVRKLLCPAGQYVSQCDNYNVGFYWLKSAKLPYQDESDGGDDGVDGEPEETEENGERLTIDTRDYYVGDTNLELFQQMRGFFSSTGDNSILYRDADTDTIQPISYATFVEDRELILKNVCHPALTSISCTKCPNGANVAESSVELDEDNLAVTGSWRFHTIADCFMTEFEDSTGTYFYVPDNAPDISVVNLDHAEHCMYTPTTANESLNGDAIGTVVPGTTVPLKNKENDTSPKGDTTGLFFQNN